jgi:hypothetical protein
MEGITCGILPHLPDMIPRSAVPAKVVMKRGKIEKIFATENSRKHCQTFVCSLSHICFVPFDLFQPVHIFLLLLVTVLLVTPAG